MKRVHRKKKSHSIVIKFLTWLWHLRTERTSTHYEPAKTIHTKKLQVIRDKPLQQLPSETDNLYERIKTGQIKGEALNDLFKTGQIKVR